MLDTTGQGIKKDIETVNNIPIVSKMLDVICRTTNMRFAAIARVTDTQWITCSSRDDIDFGLTPGDELELGTTICDEIRQHHNPVVIDHVAENPTFCNHHTPMKYGFQSYISFPIFKKTGEFFGTLCAIDPEPAKLDNPKIRGMFELYTDLIAFHLQTIETLEDTTRKLEEERKTAELRETFIAILGHDLRNPVGTTRMCADMMLLSPTKDMVVKNAAIIKATSYRMQGLIDNLLDFAKGHLGDGIRLDITTDPSVLNTSIQQVITEIKSMAPDHVVDVMLHYPKSVNCDANRVAQLLSNLLGNAIAHGASDAPIKVETAVSQDVFELKVTNGGAKIPEAAMQNLFKPFYTESTDPKKSGLGLGLYIASEIAKAHKGNLQATSSNKQTSFIFTMPL
ncbi:ATP-binding protein [Aquimarina sp. W85]|uniref:GAF domain-containing sensor histidine kinase n=1 Tax=Aquimarina rhodophyticola TaxID=3342246 RepID=UPI003671ACC8